MKFSFDNTCFAKLTSFVVNWMLLSDLLPPLTNGWIWSRDMFSTVSLQPEMEHLNPCRFAIFHKSNAVTFESNFPAVLVFVQRYLSGCLNLYCLENSRLSLRNFSYRFGFCFRRSYLDFIGILVVPYSSINRVLQTQSTNYFLRLFMVRTIFRPYRSSWGWVIEAAGVNVMVQAPFTSSPR